MKGTAMKEQYVRVKRSKRMHASHLLGSENTEKPFIRLRANPAERQPLDKLKTSFSELFPFYSDIHILVNELDKDHLLKLFPKLYFT